MNLFLWIGAGVGLFLMGMKSTGEHLTALLGARLEKWIGRATRTPLGGILSGAAFTALIQSSDATNCLVIELLDGGRLTLERAAAVMMGANIGTTMTGQLVALELTDWGPLLLLPGACLRIAGGKQNALRHVGGAMAGLGMLFLGMELVETGCAPLSGVEWVRGLFCGLESPGWALILSAALTAGLQSSSAFVGLMQTFASAGVLPLTAAPSLVMGSAIGTCATELLISAGARDEGRRAALFHLLVNCFGAAAVLTLGCAVPVDEWIRGLSGGQPSRYLANLNTGLKSLEILLLAPVMEPLVRLTRRILPERGIKSQEERV